MLIKDAPIEVLEDIVIDDGPPKMHRSWPALEAAANGDLVVAYKESSDHHRTDDGVLVVKISTDGGRSWPYKKAVAAEPGWNQDTNHGMTRLKDGSILLNIIRGRHSVQPDGEYRMLSCSAITRSRDNGRTWEERGAPIQMPFLSAAHFSVTYGRIHELADGRLMAPVVGAPVAPAHSKLRAIGVAYSRDGGKTWPEGTLIAEDRTGDICPSETDTVRLRDGRFLAIIRTNTQGILYKSFSADDGKTWTPIQTTRIPGNCPALITLASGDILCASRDRTAGREGMICAVSRDQGDTWTLLGHLYRGANWDCAYPSMVRLPSGHIYCAYYTAAEPDAVTGACDIRGLIIKDRTA